MQDNFLKLNSSKTELIQIGTVPATRRPTLQVWNLGVIFHPQLTFEAYIYKKKNISKKTSIFYHLRNVARLDLFLSFADTKRLIHAFISTG